MDFVKVPCKDCPFRNDVTPFLHPRRAMELAYAASNPYSDFPCHKTTEADDETGECYATDKSLTCAGFLTLRAQEGEDTPEGFTPSWDIIYTDAHEMIDAYEQEWES